MNTENKEEKDNGRTAVPIFSILEVHDQELCTKIEKEDCYFDALQHSEV